jgi:hypothetical protein
MVKSRLDLTLPSPDVTDQQLTETKKLLEEFHNAMSAGFWAPFKEKDFDPKTHDPFKRGDILREPIFYAAESAHSFQYREFSKEKYAQDNDWLRANKGFRIGDAVAVAKAICDFQNKKLNELLYEMRHQNPHEWTFLPGFTFTPTDVEKETKLPLDTIKKIIVAFSPPVIPCNEQFHEIGDFNITNARPIIPLGDEKYLLFQHYSILESLYESPFYWMCEDKGYRSTAMKNRGDFTETFATKKLQSVFGAKRVFQNIKIIDAFGKEAGEIDVLTLFADRAIILQAKSKRLTVEARKGNDNAIRKDFKEAIERAYEQGWECANHLLNSSYILIDSLGNKLNIRREFREVFIFCIVADHYPGLSFQARQFLSCNKHDVIRPPYIMDIFFLDVMAEFLTTPLYFLSFANRRSEYSEKVISSNEFAVLSFHITQNLWFDKEYDMINLEDSIAQDLDTAMLVRREGLPGEATPKGLLTKFKGSIFGDILEHISAVEQDGILDLGFYLLELSEDTALSVGEGIKRITNQARSDGKSHDFSIAAGGAGLTVHCNYSPPNTQLARLEAHCLTRKYSQKANKWFGFCKHGLSDNPFDTAIMLEFPWEQSDIMDNEVRKLDAAGKSFKNLKEAFTAKKKKLGRNDPCPCGSGKKFKKCCNK